MTSIAVSTLIRSETSSYDRRPHIRRLFPSTIVVLGLNEVLEEVDAMSYGHALEDGPKKKDHEPRDQLDGCVARREIQIARGTAGRR